MEKAGNILNIFLTTLLQKKENKDKEDYHNFFDRWEDIVGKKLYGHTKIIDVKNKSLVLAVDHPGWLQMVKLRERIIIKKVQKFFPQLAIRSMKITVKEDCFQIDRKPAAEDSPHLNNWTSTNGEEWKMSKSENNHENSVEFGKIRDENLKNTLKRLYLSIIKKEEES